MSINYRRWSFDDTTKNIDPSLAINRINNGSAVLQHLPKFRISKNDSIFTIGSCFAREIETWLISNDYKVSSRPELMGTGAFNLKPGVAQQDFYNRYNPASMLLEIENLTSGGRLLENDYLFYQRSDGLFDDCHYTPALEPADLETCKKRRDIVVKNLSKSFVESNVLILTLGLCESWFDNFNKVYLNVISSPFMLKRYKDRLDFVNLNYIDVVNCLDKIAEITSTKKVIVTVSPVPLTATFNSCDVIIANQAAKSILRSAAEYACKRYDNFDYFPSYEMVINSEYNFAWKPDGRHVSRLMVAEIMNLAAVSYFDNHPEKTLPDQTL